MQSRILPTFNRTNSFLFKWSFQKLRNQKSFSEQFVLNLSSNQAQLMSLISLNKNSSTAVSGFCGKVLVVGGYRGGFCEKLREASPMSDRASASQLQD